MRLAINWFGLACGIMTIAMVIVTLFYPWWQLRVGDNLVTANVSLLNTNFKVLGTVFTVPLIYAVNVTCTLMFLLVGVTMLVYSIFPSKPYSKQLLDFAYKKPLFMLIGFVFVLFVFTLLVQVVVRFNIPFVGSVTSTFNLPFTQRATVSVVISAEFYWPFWLAVAVAVLCIAARVYHRRFATTKLGFAHVPPPPPPVELGAQ
ncbi:MAG: hypothetical protein QXU99_05040 [Candidatus Bathyarchaeia archaeon]